MKNIKSEKAMLRDIAKLDVECVERMEEFFARSGIVLRGSGHDDRIVLSETKEDEIVRDMQGD